MRHLGLDLLRFLAVFLVMFRHLPGGVGRTEALAVLIQGGWIGVDVFFVLSGFLISGLLFREHQKSGRLDLVQFLIRRGFKIYPPFWVMLAVTLVLMAALEPRIPSRGLLGEILFLQNYLGGLNGHTWSLAVEEHFYLGLAALFALSTRWSPRRPFAVVPWAFAAVAALALAARILTPRGPQAFLCPGYHCYTHLRMDSLLFGVLLSWAHHYGDLERWRKRVGTGVWTTLGCLLLLPAFLHPIETSWGMSVYGVIGLYLGSGCLILAALTLADSDGRLLRLCGALGAASYSVYLWHVPVARWLMPALEPLPGMASGPLLLLAYVFLCFGIGWIMNRLVEQPSLRLRDRLFPRKATSLPQDNRTAAG